MAAGVMAFALSGAIVVIQAGFKTLDNARNTTLAAQIIQSEMERVRLLNWGDISSFTALETVDLSAIFPSTGATTEALLTRFTATRSCVNVAGYDNGMKSVTITVTWTGLGNSPHTRSATTYYCKDGLYDYYYTLAGA